MLYTEITLMQTMESSINSESMTMHDGVPYVYSYNG